jgi:uncharacterized protein
MSENFTLDSLREEVEREFAPFKIDVDGTEVVLGNPTRMTKTARKALKNAFEELDAITTAVQADAKKAEQAEKDGTEYVSEMDAEKAEKDLLKASQKIVKVAAGEHGELLVKALGDDYQLTSKVIEVWAKKVQPGEASSSES